MDAIQRMREAIHQLIDNCDYSEVDHPDFHSELRENILLEIEKIGTFSCGAFIITPED